MSRLFTVIVEFRVHGKRRSSNFLELQFAPLRGFCYTARAFGRKGGSRKLRKELTGMNRKTTTHCAIAGLGSATGSLALFYLVFPWSLTLKNFGLSVEDQLVAQRVLTPLLFVALGVVIVLIKPVFRAGLVKENGITCDMGKLGNMRKGVKGRFAQTP